MASSSSSSSDRPMSTTRSRPEPTVIYAASAPPTRRPSIFQAIFSGSSEPSAESVEDVNITRAVGTRVRTFFGLDEDPTVHQVMSLYPTVHSAAVEEEEREEEEGEEEEGLMARAGRRMTMMVENVSRFSRYLNGERFTPPSEPLPQPPTADTKGPPPPLPERRPKSSSTARKIPKERPKASDMEKGKDVEMTILKDPKIREQLAKMKLHPPWFLLLCSLVQIVMMYYALYTNATTLGYWFEPPEMNWMLGPSSITLIQLGANYAPCITSTFITENNYICPSWLNGTFYQADGMTAYCGDFGEFCQMGGFKQTNEPDQWWRFFSAIFLHGGIIHLGMNLLTQVRLGFDIERSLGSFRVMIIYTSSGVFGFLLSAIFNKITPGIGCSGALYGLVAVLLVDLCQNWRLVRNAGKELATLLLVILISIAIGLLPYLDNFAHIGGFVMGIISSVIFVPSITFGKWQRRRKIVLICIAIPAYLFLLCGTFFVFYSGLDASKCLVCLYFDCIPFVDGWCGTPPV